MMEKDSSRILYWVIGIIGAVFVLVGLVFSLRHMESFIGVISYLAVIVIHVSICRKAGFSEKQTFLPGSLCILLLFGVSGILSLIARLQVPSYLAIDKKNLWLDALTNSGSLAICIGLILCLLAYLKLFGWDKKE